MLIVYSIPSLYERLRDCTVRRLGQVSAWINIDKKVMTEFSVSKKIKRLDSEWRALLGDQRYHVLREKGTERAFTGRYLDLNDDGLFACGACGQALFSSETNGTEKNLL